MGFSEEDDMRMITEVTSAPLVDKTTMEESMLHSLPSLPSKDSVTEQRKHLVDADMVKFILKPPSRRSSIATTYQGEVSRVVGGKRDWMG